MKNLSERLDKHLHNIKESKWYRDLYKEDPAFIPLEELYKELIRSKYHKFKIGTNKFELTDKNASGYIMKGFGSSKDPDQRVIEWSTPKWTKSLRYGNYKVYLGFKDITVPIDDLKYQLRFEMTDLDGHDLGTDSFIIYPKDTDSIEGIADKVFDLVLKYTKEGLTRD